MLRNRQDACSTKREFYCGVGIRAAPERLIENVQDVSAIALNKVTAAGQSYSQCFLLV
jgi:hypothetical protein